MVLGMVLAAQACCDIHWRGPPLAVEGHLRSLPFRRAYQQ